MKNFIITADSCSDLPLNLVKEMDLRVIPLSVEVGGNVYRDYPDEREIKVKDFYELLRDKKVAKTSMINVNDFIDFFEKLLKEDKDILYIGFSSALSGTVNSAAIAREEIMNKYPNRKIIIIDSLSASLGLGLLIYYADKLRSEGKPIDEVATWVEANKLKLCHLFTVADLGTLRRGGRLSGTAAFFGDLLRVKPVLHVDNEGRLVPLKKARGRNSSLIMLVEMMKEAIVDSVKQTIFLSHGDDLETATNVGKMIQDEMKVKKIIYGNVGPIIGAHSGPGTIAIFFMGKER